MRTLVAVDGSKFAEEAVAVVADLARQTGIEVILTTILHPDDVHATFAPTDYVNVPVPTGPPGGKVMTGVVTPPLRAAEDRTQALERVRLDAQEYLDGLVAARLVGVSAETRIAWSSDTAEAIVAAAKESGASLIAVGTHGRSGMSRLLMGSVAEAVLRLSRIPVLVVRAPDADSPA